MLGFIAMAHQCAPSVDQRTLAALVSVESGENPYAIGVVGGHLVRQPRSLDEAVVTAQALDGAGWNFSVGIAQVNKKNLPKYGMTYTKAFEPCANLSVGAEILKDCFLRASTQYPDQQAALRAAFSCYYSGNFTRGFQPDAPGGTSYVAKVLAQAGKPVQPIAVVPAVNGTAAAPASAASTSLPPVVHASVMVHAAKASAPTEPADHSPVLVHRSTDVPATPAPASTSSAAALPADDRVRHVQVY